MITYNVIDVKMPEISHRETTKWVRAVAASYVSEWARWPTSFVMTTRY